MSEPFLEKINWNFNFADLKFYCEETDLNQFFYKDAKKYIKEDFAQMYLLRIEEDSRIIGFFTLNSTNIKESDNRIFFKRKIGLRWIPGVLIGQLAVDSEFQEKGFGKELVISSVDIIKKISEKIGCRVVIVDSLTNLKALNLYLKLGFEFVDIKLGNNILNKLTNKENVNRKSLKMFLDLQKLSL